MGMIQVRVQDISGSRVCDVEAPDDVAINRILALLVERMNLPLNSPDGQIMSYKLHHRRTGQQLLDKQTLAEAGVVARDELRLQPEITAGHGCVETRLLSACGLAVRASKPPTTTGAHR